MKLFAKALLLTTLLAGSYASALDIIKFPYRLLIDQSQTRFYHDTAEAWDWICYPAYNDRPCYSNHAPRDNSFRATMLRLFKTPFALLSEDGGDLIIDVNSMKKHLANSDFSKEEIDLIESDFRSLAEKGPAVLDTINDVTKEALFLR